MPRWLGEIYAKVYVEFGLELFTLKEAISHLRIPQNRMMVAWSKLHSLGAVTVFRRSRPRLYRLQDPGNLMMLFSGRVRKLEIEQEAYAKLVYDAFRETQKILETTSLALYGSVARGTAGAESDIDLLIISDELSGSIVSRIDDLIPIEERLKGELAWLRHHGIHTSLAFYPLRRKEAEKLPILFLDLVDEVVIIQDQDRFLERLLDQLKGRLATLGARKVVLEDGSWYWDLKPDYRPLEVIKL
ncbi:MAG: nucleotidyltransferase domain-containing protein [Candidatus Bathyarchaeia archaeon]